MYARGGPRPPEGTLTALFLDALRKHDRPDALLHRVATNSWRPISHRTVLERVRRVALGLRELGIARGDRVAILSENRPEWAIADYACLTAGLTDVPIYPTLPAEQIPYILNDSGAVALFVSTTLQAARPRRPHARRRRVARHGDRHAGGRRGVGARGPRREA